MDHTCKFQACEECAHKCLLIHGSKDPSPVVSSFFKVLIGDKFMNSLVIPPSFAQTIKSLVDQTVDLEDPKGRRWAVQISFVDDFLVFKQGWHQFASDHSLEIGEFLVFHYIIRSHFVVQIYCKSGREKVNFSQTNTGSKESSTSAETTFDILAEDGQNSSPAEVSNPIDGKRGANERGSYSPVHSDSTTDTIPNEPNVSTVEVMPVSTEKAVPCGGRAAVTKPLLPNVCTEIPFYIDGKRGANKRGSYSPVHSDSTADTIPNEPNVSTMEVMPVSTEKAVPCGGRAAVTKPLLPNVCTEIPFYIDGKRGANERGSYSSVHSDSNADTIPSEPYVSKVEVMPVLTEKAVPCGDKAMVTKPLLPNVCTEIPFYMIKREPTEASDATRSSPLDLFDFEMVKGRSGVEIMGKGPVIRENMKGKDCVEKQCDIIDKELGGIKNACKGPVIRENMKGKDCVEKQCDIIDKELGGIKNACTRPPSGITGFNVPETRCCARDVEKVPMFEKQFPMDDHTPKQPQRWDSVKKVPVHRDNILMGGFSSIRPEKRKHVFSGNDSTLPMNFDVISGISRSLPNTIKQEPGCGSVPTISRKHLPAKRLKVATEEHVEKVAGKRGRKPGVVKVEIQEEVTPGIQLREKAGRAVVKTEDIDSGVFPASVQAQYCTAVHAVAPSFLEFPSGSRTPFCTGRMKQERRMVLLRDSANRDWPVLYHEEMGFRILGNGWSALAKANNIQQGDMCIFEEEDVSEMLFRVKYQCFRDLNPRPLGEP